MCFLSGTTRVFIAQKTEFFVVTAVKTSNLTQHSPPVLCNGDVMCFLWGTNWVFISQKTTFFMVTAVRTSNLTLVQNYPLSPTGISNKASRQADPLNEVLCVLVYDLQFVENQLTFRRNIFPPHKEAAPVTCFHSVFSGNIFNALLRNVVRISTKYTMLYWRRHNTP
jgi:hypothetical protein